MVVPIHEFSFWQLDIGVEIEAEAFRRNYLALERPPTRFSSKDVHLQIMLVL